MKQLIALGVIAAFASGLIGTWAFNQLTEQAGAAPPPPSPTQVREQNLDGSGFIRVHEQGTANVAGTVNIGNMPAVQDVNVVSLPTQTGQVIEVGTIVVPTNGSARFAAVDVSECSETTAIARRSGGSPSTELIDLRVSVDGQTFVNADFLSTTGSISGGAASLGAWPFVEFGAVNSGDTANVTAWIWCEP
jgi:hypothetical protein